jgi:hypothetical protein
VWNNTCGKVVLRCADGSLKDTLFLRWKQKIAIWCRQRFHLSGGASLCCLGYRPAARRAASSICAVPKTRTIAAIVAISFAGSVTVGCGGHLISIASGVSGRWTSSTTSRSDWVTAPPARNPAESLDTELFAGPELAISLVFHRCEQFVCRCQQDHKISRNCAGPYRQLPGLVGGSLSSSSHGFS